MDTAPDTTAAYPRRMLKDGSLSTLALRVWGRCFQLACLQMGGFPESWSAKEFGNLVDLALAQVFTLSIRSLATHVGTSQRAARAGLKELIRAGYVHPNESGEYALPWTLAELFKQGNFQRIQRPPDTWTNSMRRLFFVLHLWPSRKAWVNQKDLARRCGFSRKAIIHTTRDLERIGVISVERRTGKSNLLACRMAVQEPLPERLPIIQKVTPPHPKGDTPATKRLHPCNQKVTPK